MVGSERRDLSCEVIPGGIGCLDQTDFLFSSPSLDLLFAGYRRVHVVHGFVIDQTGYFVSPGEPRGLSFFVFTNPSIEVIGDACVEDS